MKVKHIYVYPIKSLRGVALDEAILTKNGMPYDRKFMLVKVNDDASIKIMMVGKIAAMGLFTTELNIPDPGKLESASIEVTFNPPEGDRRSISVPLTPNTTGLDSIRVTMHGSEGMGFVMDRKYRDWFSECFGFDCALIYVGENERPVLCSNPHSAGSLLSSITKSLPMILPQNSYPDRIRFHDCVPYLVVSETSCHEVSSRLPEGVEMDIRKFRPNIVVEGAKKAWEEDYWGELMVGDVKIITAHNCGRCQSLNVDFKTGKYKTGATEMPLKTLMKDRRVDTGHKYDPVFGRYSYINNKDDGKQIRVGDEVKVLKQNAAMTTFDWSGKIGGDD